MSKNPTTQQAQSGSRAPEAPEQPPFGPGITKMSQLGYGKGYARPDIRHVDGNQGTSPNLVDSKDEDVRRQMDIFVHLHPDKVLPLHIGNVRSWRTDLWATLASTPIARRMLVGLEYGPGMNKSDPTAYTAKYSSDFDVALGGFLARNVSSHLRGIAITKLFRQGEERGTVILDHLTDEVQKHSSVLRQKLLEEYVLTRQEPTESIKQFATRFSRLCEQMDDLDVGKPKAEDEKAIDLLTRLLPKWKDDAHWLASIADSGPKEQPPIISSLQSTIIWMEQVEGQELELARKHRDGG
ncbi:hypothetical protein CF319_g8325 [Tilletia indica]|nr:hypothetical protein CF319_g8325 [Tilletia indica]